MNQAAFIHCVTDKPAGVWVPHSVPQGGVCRSTVGHEYAGNVHTKDTPRLADGVWHPDSLHYTARNASRLFTSNIARTAKRTGAWLVIACVCLVLVACGDGGEQGPPAGEPLTDAQIKAIESDPVRIVFLGDSLTAGYGLEVTQAYPALLENMLKDEKLNVRVSNGGVSGDTSAGGLKRLNWLLNQKPDIVVVALGANDGLRAQEAEFTKKNLRAIVEKVQEAKAEVLLLGMQMPPNYGPIFTEQFKKIYVDLAQEKDVLLMPFMLKDVGGKGSLNQSDGVHPTAQGQEIMAKNILPYLRKLVKTRAASKSEAK